MDDDLTSPYEEQDKLKFLNDQQLMMRGLAVLLDCALPFQKPPELQALIWELWARGKLPPKAQTD